MKKKIIALRLHPMQYLALFYLIVVMIATIFFYAPFALQEGVTLSFLDALFTAVSVVSVTGLTVIPIHETFNTIGVVGMLLFLQVGGIGVMALSTFFWLLSKKRIGLKERQLIMSDQNRTDLAGMVHGIKNILVMFVSVEIIGMLLLGLLLRGYYPSAGSALYHGLFITVNALTNGGFDLTGSSLAIFHDNYIVQSIVMLLIIIGSIGFPVLLEVKEYLLSPRKKQYRFSLFTKLTTTMFFLLVVGGTIGIYLFEHNQWLQGKSWHEALFYSLFQSVATRSGGLATMNVALFSQTTLLLLSLFMFIGASPSSVGGGIRTTTFALNLLSVYNFARGNKEVRIFKREVMKEDLSKAMAVGMMGIFLCVTALLILSYTEVFPLEKILFEIMSAFGTTGLSVGIVGEFSGIGKLVIIVLMFIGRIGIIPTLFLFRKGKNGEEAHFHYPKEKIIIG